MLRGLMMRYGESISSKIESCVSFRLLVTLMVLGTYLVGSLLQVSGAQAVPVVSQTIHPMQLIDFWASNSHLLVYILLNIKVVKG